MKLIRDIWAGLPFQVRVIALALIGVLVILLFVLARVDSCRTRRDEQRIERIKSNIVAAEAEANVLTNKQVEVETNVNKTTSDLGNVLGVDSGNRESDFGTVKRRFCEDHPGDSTCRK